jgi:hypothetical protein
MKYTKKVWLLVLLFLCFLGTLLPLTSGFPEEPGYRVLFIISLVIGYSILLSQIKFYRFR